VAEAREQWRRLGTEGCRAENAAEWAEVFTTRQLCYAHLVYLEALLFFVASGVGSRGSALTLHETGEPLHRLLGQNWKAKKEDESFREKVLETVFADGDFRHEWIQRRPLPETESWFETDWAVYREGRVYD